MEIKKFKGTWDPNRLVFNGVFPFCNLVIASPIVEAPRYHQVIFQGNKRALDSLAEDLRVLVFGTIIDERHFGRWYALGPHEQTGGLALYYDSYDVIQNKISFLSVVLRNHLITIAGLKLSQISVIEAYSDNRKFLELPVVIPADLDKTNKENRKFIVDTEIPDGSLIQ